MKKTGVLPALTAVLLFLACTFPVQAAGPEKVATLDRSLWPEPITDAAAFDRASRAEILTFVRLMSAADLSSVPAIQALTGLKQVNLASVRRWQQVTRQRLLSNYQAACAGCDLSTGWPALREQAFGAALVDNGYRAWQQASERFHRRYLYEQVRLAALFPRITSEIATFRAEDAGTVTEISGFELPDRRFLLSYDDGPSPARTAPLVSALNNAGIQAYFFVLGEKLAAQSPQPGLYRDQCLASHGYRHNSHQTAENWAASLQATQDAIDHYRSDSAATPAAFRPPYGQRSQALTADLAARGGKLVLWNIDSQDWNRTLTAEQVQDRVQTLMLLWRRGIILYHDIHAKAQHNLPGLIRFQQQAALQWQSCRNAF